MNISQNHKAISSAIATVLLIVGLAVGAGAGYFYVSSTASGTTKTVTNTVGGTTVTTSVTGAAGPVTYTIGTVLPTTQTYGSYGVSFQNSVNLAVKQMNANLTAVGSNIQFKVVSADDAGTASGALSALQSEFQTSGIQVEIGPLTTGEVLGLVQYASQNHIVILPGASTGTAASGVSPYLFRPGQPGDQFEATVVAQSIIQTGGKNVVYLYRDDTSETGTFNRASTIMKAAGLQVQGIALPANQADYSAQVQTASADLSTYLSAGGTLSNTVVALGDGGTEAQNVFQHAATDPNLGKVRWYGIESLADPTLLKSSVGAFMSQVSLTIAAPQVLNSPQFQYFNTTYSKEYGKAPLPYSNYFYDNAWIAMLSILAAGSNDGTKIVQVVPLVAEHFFGSSSTGIWLVNHDQNIAFYDVLKCEVVSGANTFVKIGSYNGGTNQLTLT
ncbi:MAG TPA: ABC transporter substrate-binding protein [Nitrososphaerales archaeon]|nr:ABC transporter substrate-binding protein [Nitrososphaerales archaeon]